jgi:hypothetical protein
MALYREHAAAIDPSTATGELRVRWLLDSRRPLAAEFEELLIRATAVASDEATRFAASVASAQFPQRRGDFRAAETILRRALASVGGTQSRRETSAAMNLAGVLRAQHKEFEALVVARRAARLAERLGPPNALAAALVHVAAALVEVGDHRAFDGVAARLEALLASLDPREAETLRRSFHRCRADSFTARGDFAAAAKEIALRDALPAESWMTELAAEDDAMRRARTLVAEARFAEALELVAAHRRPAGPHNRAWLEWAAIDAACRARMGDASACGKFVDELDHVGPETLGTGAALRAALLVAEALPNGPGASACARGFAAEMLAARIAEVDACAAALDELSADADEDRPLLAALRALLVRDHAALLASLDDAR